MNISFSIFIANGDGPYKSHYHSACTQSTLCAHIFLQSFSDHLYPGMHRYYIVYVPYTLIADCWAVIQPLSLPFVRGLYAQPFSTY